MSEPQGATPAGGNPFDAAMINAIDATPDDGDGGEDVEGDVNAGDDGGTGGEGVDGGDADGDDGAETTPDTKFKIGEHEITLKEFEELKAAGMRQRDYTKKTTALAQEKRALLAEQNRFKEQSGKFREYLHNLANPQLPPDRLIAMLERGGVPIRNALLHVLEQRIAEVDLPPDEKLRRERAQFEAQKRADEEERRQALTRQEHQQQVARLQKDFAVWIPQALKAAGLPESKFIKMRLAEHMRPVSQSGKAITYEDFAEAAQLAKAEWLEERAGLNPDDLAEELSDEEKRRKLAIALQQRNRKPGAPPAITRQAARPVARAQQPSGRPLTMAEEMRMMGGKR